jgi:hypothetical protein
MSRLESAIERLRALPAEEHDLMAGEIEALLKAPASLLTAAQWLEVEAELSATDGAAIPHSEVMTRMRNQFGR